MQKIGTAFTPDNKPMPPAVTSTRAELYPIPEDPEVRRLIFRKSRKEFDERGKMLIAAPLTADERAMIHKRMRVVAEGVTPAADRMLKNAVLELLSGMASTEREDVSAAVTVTQFVTVLRGLPYFAVKRACDRFASGMVTAEEIGGERVSRTFRPSTAQLRIVAENIARPYWDEASVGHLLLNAEVERPMVKSAESRQRAADFRRSFSEQVAAAEIEERNQTARDMEYLEAHKFNRDRDALIEGYRARGLEPVFADPLKVHVTSIEMLLHNGWSIEEVEGRPTLMRPRRSA